jgi:uncharacterized membrane protein
MLMLNYRSKLDRDLARWRDAGWITPTGADSIRADLASRRSGMDLASSLGILGAVLIGFAIMSFVAANWPNMSKLGKIGLIATVIIASYATAFALFKRRLEAFGQAAVLAGTAAFGGGIMLIAQIYHMDGHAPDAVWLWAVGALVAGYTIQSNPALALATVLIAIWSCWEMSMGRGVHWGFLPMWALAAGGFALTRWVPGMHLVSIALAGWIISLGYRINYGSYTSAYDMGGGHQLVVLIGVALALTSVFAGEIIDRVRRISGAMLGYGMVIAFAGMFALQFFKRTDDAGLLVYGVVTLAALIGALVWAWRTENRPALALAYTGFSIEIFALYIKKLGTLMNTSAFFLVTGLLVIALSAAAFRLHAAVPKIKQVQS